MMKKIAKNLLSLVLVWCLFFIFTFTIQEPVNSEIIKQQENNQSILYKSKHTVRDNQGNPWQIILFKRIVSEETKEVNLRLVGFPDVINFNHPQNLMILTSNQQQLIAEDEFAQKSPSANVGQYDLKPILLSLIQNKSLILSLPVQPENLTINLPYPVLLEWEELVNY